MKALLVVLAAAGVAHADDLVATGAAAVSVSSTVANPKLPPAALVDGNPETAWNSRTGDLHPWLAVALPASAHVTAVALTSGFTHVDGKDDWFTMNPRIAHVQVSQGGALLADAPLDVRSRALQSIAIAADGRGGPLRIDVVETVAGTKPDWREVPISELQVIGTATGTFPGKPQPVRVGGTPPPAPATPAPPAGPMLVVRTAPVTLVALAHWDAAATPRGAPRTLAEGRTLQPIEPPARTAWIGLPVKLYSARAQVCEGAIQELGLVDGGWLVGVVAAKAPCTGALFARPAAARAPSFGALTRTTALRDAVHAQYFAPHDDAYAHLYEHYLLVDLNGEYGDSDQAERAIPVADRLSEANLDKTWKYAAACDAKQTMCFAVATAAHARGAATWGYRLDGGKVTTVPGRHLDVDGRSVDFAGAVDVDGDGALDVVFTAPNLVGVFGVGTEWVVDLGN